jgi:hypothetical protein
LFTSAELAQPMRIAVSVPLNELAASGFTAVLFTLLIVGYVEYVMPLLPAASRAANAPGASRSRRLSLVANVVGLLVLMAFVFLFAGPVFLILTGLAGAVATSLGAYRRRRGSWSDRFAITALVLLYGVAGVTAGFTARPPAAAHVSFSEGPDSPLPGWFVPLALTDQTVFLAPCPDPGRVIEVLLSRVTLVEWPIRGSQDLIDSLRALGVHNLYANCS